MNGTRIGLAILLIGALAAYLAFSGNETADDSHRLSRQLVLHFTLNRTDKPIVVLGDSIVEASTLPRSLCGHPVVNAGLSRASTASDLGTWLADALGGKQVAAIVIALGMNDALISALSIQQFQLNYGALLAQLSTRTPRLFVLAIPPVVAQKQITPETQTSTMARINDYNSILPELATKNGATFIALPPMPQPHTVDGVHLNAAGDLAWEKAVLQGVSTICNSN
jgi:lysophospholipase L1-like esterase